MKILTTILFTFLSFISPVWLTNFNDAKVEASKNNKLILVNFSGSDWCLPCMRLKNLIFDSEDFSGYANDNLVLVNADFPREKKHKLLPEQKQLNEALADKFDPDGKFPYTLLMTSDGKVIKQWDGQPDDTAKQFVDEIKQIINALR